MMTVQMIRSDVQDRTDLRMKMLCGLQLKAADLCHSDRILIHLFHCCRVRISDVSYNENGVSHMLHDGSQEAGGCRFSIGSRDGQHVAFSKSVGQLHLAPDLQPFFLKMKDQRKVRGNTGT